jgi:ABC-type Fe3+/spermidine/putrescine transport system ATPase subunit
MSTQPQSVMTLERAPDEHPVLVLDHVSLAFDDKVVLRDVSFSLLPGHTKILLGASGSSRTAQA